jgi:septum formation protein
MHTPLDRSRLILASKSPRRSQLLEQAGLTFSVIPSDFDESAVALSDPDSYVITLAESKARDVSQKYPAAWIIGADTIVLIDQLVLGKPASRQEAAEMLQRLSGKTHQVLTGYCICCEKENRLFSECVKTDVRFKRLINDEINWYIQTGEPFDKAGGYAIQGLGTFLVKSISGSYTNVVGLPVCEVIEFLTREGVVELNPTKR